MTHWGYEDESNTGQGNDNEMSGPKALRDAYDKLKQQNDELNSKLTSFLEDQAREKMSTVFQSLGVPEAQSVYQGPNDPQKAKEWVESMRSVFGGNSQGGNPATETVVEQQPAGLPPSMQRQFDQFVSAGQEGQPLGNLEAAQAAVNDANDIQSLVQAFQNGMRTN